VYFWNKLLACCFKLFFSFNFVLYVFLFSVVTFCCYSSWWINMNKKIKVIKLKRLAKSAEWRRLCNRNEFMDYEIKKHAWHFVYLHKNVMYCFIGQRRREWLNNATCSNLFKHVLRHLETWVCLIAQVWISSIDRAIALQKQINKQTETSYLKPRCAVVRDNCPLQITLIKIDYLAYYIEKKLHTVYPMLYKPTLKNSEN